MFRTGMTMCCVLLCLTNATRAAAQLAAGMDFTLASRYVWRGTTRVDGPVLQPAAYLAFAWRSTFVAVGGWANAELTRSSPGEATLVNAGNRGVGEVDAWLSLSGTTNGFDWRVGASRYDVRHDPRDIARGRLTTTELWGVVSARGWPVIPRVGAWLDFDEVRGRYYELGLAYPFAIHPLAEPVGSLLLSAELGVSDGQSSSLATRGAAGYFDREGVTHGALGAAMTFDLGAYLPGALNTAVHYVIGRGPRASSVEGIGRARGLWAEASLSLAVGLAGFPGESRR